MTRESETETAFNPYQSPNSPQQSAIVPVAQPVVQPGLPVFCTVMLIISIICSLFKSVIILPDMMAFSDIIKAYDYHFLAYMDLIVQVALLALYTWAVILYDRWDRQRSMATLGPQSLPNDFQNPLGK